MKTLIHLIEFGLARILLFFFDHFPYRITCSISRGAANLWYWADYRRRKVAQNNILRSGVVSDPKQARTIARHSIQFFALLIVDSLRSDRLLNGENWKEHIKLDISPDVMEVIKDSDQALILGAGHFGNWEIAAHFLSQFKPVAGITREMNNPLIEKLIKKRKPRYQFRTVPKNESNAGRLIKELDDHNVLALLFDQHAGNKGEMVYFFGHPASTHKAIAMLHLVTRTPLCYGYCIRTGPMKFTVSTSPLIQHVRSGNKEKDIHAILSQLNKHLEDTIRKDPEQYLWAHRRWRD